MIKKLALLAAGLGAALLVGCGAEAESSQTILEAFGRTAESSKSDTAQVVLRLTHSSGEESVVNDAAEAMKKRLEAVSGGTMSIEIFANDSLGSLNDAWSSFGNGAVDIRIGTADIPQQGAVMWLPLLSDADLEQLESACVRGKPLRMKIESWSKEKNSMVLGMLPMQYRVLASNVPVESMENMRQLTMRTIGSGGDNAYWEILCGKTKDVNVQKLALALQQKEVNACDNTVTNLVEYGTYRQVRYITQLGNCVYFDMILMNRGRMEKLDERQQQWVQDAASYAENKILENWQQYKRNALEKIEAQGIAVYTLSEEEKQRIRQSTRGAIENYYREKIGEEALSQMIGYVQAEKTPQTEEN